MHNLCRQGSWFPLAMVEDKNSVMNTFINTLPKAFPIVLVHI